jgi:hypothetical protein
LRDSVFIFIKEINVYIRPNDLSKVTDILQKHKLGITFFDIQGTDRLHDLPPKLFIPIKPVEPQYPNL